MRALLALLLVLGCAAAQEVQPAAPFACGFEGPIEGQWRLDKIVPGRWVVQDGVASEGSRSLAITLRPGDLLRDGAERAELQEPVKFPLGAALRYAVDLRLPADTPPVRGRLVLLQVKQEGDRSPVFALRYAEGQLTITSDVDAGRARLFRGPFAAGAWHRVEVHARFVPDATGAIDVWLDGARVVEHRGVTAYAAEGPRTYLKLGLYRDAETYPLTLFVDRFRRE